MTYSICTTNGTQHGIAIATKALSVGSSAPQLSKHGGLCSQSITNVPLGVRAARLVDDGAGVDAAVSTLLARDEDAPLRQIHGIDEWGNSIVHSGEDCVDWFGHIEKKNYTIAGNMLEGKHVIESMADTFEDTKDMPIGDRLIDTLLAGENAGGDKRDENAQSAAIKIYDPDNPAIHHDIRVDDHEDPVNELSRIFNIGKEQNNDWEEKFPKSKLQRLP
jgi:uncharacterized Ntn-hydrolase superfamily protein